MLTRRLLPIPLLAALLLVQTANAPEALSSAATGGVRESSTAPDAHAQRSAHRQHCHVCRAAERAGLTLTALRPRPRMRCPPHDYPLWATAPRGRARLRDLEHLRVDLGIDIDEAFMQDARIELRCGAARLATLRFATDGFRADVKVPSSLRSKLRGLRGRITWGATSAQGEQAQAGFWIDPPSAEENRAVAALHAALEGEPGWIHELLEAQLLLDQQFDDAARRAAKAVLERRPREPHAAAILQAAHVYMGLSALEEAYLHDVQVVWPLWKARRQIEHRCHLDRAAPRLHSRERRPLGGCR